jgi:hypothetical protein
MEVNIAFFTNRESVMSRVLECYTEMLKTAVNNQASTKPTFSKSAPSLVFIVWEYGI